MERPHQKKIVYRQSSAPGLHLWRTAGVPPVGEFLACAACGAVELQQLVGGDGRGTRLPVQCRHAVSLGALLLGLVALRFKCHRDGSDLGSQHMATVPCPRDQREPLVWTTLFFAPTSLEQIPPPYLATNPPSDRNFFGPIPHGSAFFCLFFW
jgi:hypothetical protein